MLGGSSGATSLPGGSYVGGGVAPLGPAPHRAARAPKDAYAPLWAAEARAAAQAAAAAGAAKRVTFSGVP